MALEVVETVFHRASDSLNPFDDEVGQMLSRARSRSSHDGSDATEGGGRVRRVIKKSEQFATIENRAPRSIPRTVRLIVRPDPFSE